MDEAALARFADTAQRLDVDGPGGLPAARNRLTNDALGRDDLLLQELSGGAAQGVSGAPVFLAKDTSGEVVAITKQFPKVAELAQELSSLDRLGSEEFEHFHTPGVLGVATADLPEGTAGVLVMSRAPGRSLHEVISGLRESTDKAADWAQARMAVADSAKALAELHSRSAVPDRAVSEAYLEGNFRGARTAAAKLATEHDQLLRDAGIDPGSLGARVDELYEAMLADPGAASVVHGDAHAGNIFWAPGEPGASSGQVTFIDVSLAHFSMDRFGSAIGTPARDTIKLERWLERYSLRGFTPEEANDLRDTFVEAYRANGGPAVPEATSSAFTTRYALGSVLGEVRNAARPNMAENIRRILVQQRNYEFGTLRKALGQQR